LTLLHPTTAAITLSVMSSFDIPSVCPLTKEALPESSLDSAVVFGVAVPSSKTKTFCGHVCTMGALVNHIEDNKGPIKCPTCEKSHVISVCDLDAAQKLCASDDDSSRAELITFRYGPQVYYLTVSECTTAQDRISQVLGIEDVQVLHHGKTVHPDSNKTDDEVSSALLDISQSEKGKPTLVISGKRTGRWGAQGGHVHR
jgi:hypothetical protein